MMRRILCLVLVLAALPLLASLAGCGAGDAGEPDMTKAVDMAGLRDAMLSAGTFPEMENAGVDDDGAEDDFVYLSDLDYEKVDGYFLSYAADGASYELAVILLKDGADAAAAEASLRDHLEGRINLYKNYSPEDLPRAEEALVGSNGRYAYLIMCDDPSSVKNAMTEYIKK